jgi:uncharacterized protein (DUF927 family)
MDYNEVRQKAPLEELTEAARKGPALVPRDWEPVADYGMEVLKNLTRAVEACGDKDAGRRLLSPVMGDERAILSIATALRHWDTKVAAEYAKLDTVGMGETFRAFKSLVRSRLKEVDQRAERNILPTGLDFLTKAIGVTGLRAPEGYTVSVEGVAFEGAVILRCPAVLLRSTRSPRWTGDEVAWLDRGVWHRELVRHSVLAEPRSLVSHLADRGLPVVSTYAAALVKYFDDFKRENQLEELMSTNGFGWTLDRQSFLIGEDCLGKPALLGLSAADKRGFDTAGTFEGWCAAVKTHLARHPRMLVGILAAVAAPLLTVLDAPGFTLSLVGTSGSGKTTVMRCAASVSGGCMMRPHEKNIQTWASSSMAAQYARLAVAGNIALLLDDTKNVRNEGILSDVLYAVPEGKPRAQANTDLTEKTGHTWHTILISTGESSILDAGTKSGGSAARTIEISGSMISGKPDDVDFQGMVHDLDANHGWMIRKVVQFALDNPLLWGQWRLLRQKYVDEMESVNGIEGRLHEHVATLRFAADICRSVGLMVNFEAAIEEVKRAAERSASAAQRMRQAMERLWAWIALNRNEFHGGERRDPPNGGWLGEIADGVSEVGIQPWVFEHQMTKNGFRPADILEALRQQDLLRMDGGRNPKGRSGARLLFIQGKAFDQ